MLEIHLLWNTVKTARGTGLAIDERQTKHGSSRGVANMRSQDPVGLPQHVGMRAAHANSSGHLFLSVFVTPHATELWIFMLALWAVLGSYLLLR